MISKARVLLNYAAVSNGSSIWVQGQIVKTRIRNFNFSSFGTLKTMVHILRLYALKPVKDATVVLVLGSVRIPVQTNTYGIFSEVIPVPEGLGNLQSVTVGNVAATIIPSLYTIQSKVLQPKKILVTDIDDTILETHISNKVKKLITVLFTKVARRKTVKDAVQLTNRFSGKDAGLFYLSNSEQNLYPIIYHFLRINNFPNGPIFLKFLRSWKRLFIGKKLPEGNTHKLETLKRILGLFPNARTTLLGDNTQEDLATYLQIAQEFPYCIHQIIIRQVKPNKHDIDRMERAEMVLNAYRIKIQFKPYFEELEWE